MQYWDFNSCKVKCSIFTPFSHDTKGAQSCWDSNMNQGQLTHSQLLFDLTGTPVKTETGFSIQMGERVGQTDSPARLNADRLPSAVRTKGMKMTTLPKLATDETCTAEWPWCTAPICLCVQVLHYMWVQPTPLLTLCFNFISENISNLSTEIILWMNFVSSSFIWFNYMGSYASVFTNPSCWCLHAPCSAHCKTYCELCSVHACEPPSQKYVILWILFISFWPSPYDATLSEVNLDVLEAGFTCIRAPVVYYNAAVVALAVTHSFLFCSASAYSTKPPLLCT